MKGKFPTIALNGGIGILIFLYALLADGGGKSYASPLFTLKISLRLTRGKFSKLETSCLNKFIVASSAGNLAMSKPQILSSSSLCFIFLERYFNLS